MSEKFCKDCVHFRRERSFLWMMLVPIFGQLFAIGLWRDATKFGKCRASHGVSTDDYYLVGAGGKRIEFYHASTMRKFDCGPEGKMFEARR